VKAQELDRVETFISTMVAFSPRYPAGPDLHGRRFGRLQVLHRMPKPARVLASAYSRGRHWWAVECDCGTVTTACHKNLIKGNTTSCGCRKRETSTANLALAGHPGTTRESALRSWETRRQKYGPNGRRSR
jgi:hypothetical protein